MKNKKNIIKNFLNQGFSVVDCENPNKLELIKEKIYKLEYLSILLAFVGIMIIIFFKS